MELGLAGPEQSVAAQLTSEPSYAAAFATAFPGDAGGSPATMRVPTLRNVALSGPYMHDGRFPTLDAGRRATHTVRRSESMTDSTSDGAVLYLDDEEPLVFLVTRLLKRLGYEACGFTTAPEALTAFESDPSRYKLILTDLSMPGASGFDFARAVLAIAPDSRVAVLTGHVDEADMTRATALGIRAVIQKPLTLAELEPVLQQLLR